MRRCPDGRRATDSASATATSKAKSWRHCSPAFRRASSRAPSSPAGKRWRIRSCLARRSGGTPRLYGARFRQGVVEGVGGDSTGATVFLADGSVHRTGKVVIAAGAWSHLLAKDLRDHIPLETERGYNTTLPVEAFDVRRQLIFPGHGFVITPMQTGLRVGGAVELAGLKRPPNFARARAMLQKAQNFLPGLDPQGGTRMDGVSPVAPGFAAGDRPRIRAQCVLRIRPRSSRPDAGRSDGPADPRPRHRAGTCDRSCPLQRATVLTWRGIRSSA